MPSTGGNSNNNSHGSGSRDVVGAAVPFSARQVGQRSSSDVDVLDNGVPVSCQRLSTPTTNNGAVGYGGTEKSERFRGHKHTSDDANDSGDIVVPPTGDGARPPTSMDVDGECIIADGGGGAVEGADAHTCMGKVRHFLLNNDPLLFASLKWGLAALLLLFLAFVVFGMLYSGLHYGDSCNTTENVTLTEGMPGWCHTRFGTILGVYQNTYSYSNCNDDYVSLYDAFMNFTVPVLSTATGLMTPTSTEFYTGLQWQCVEYARRYWMQNGRPKPAYFGSVDGAADIWDLTEVHLLENTSQTLPLLKYKSGDRVVRDGLKPPQAGDIIIYPVQAGGFPVGHVAVITQVEIGAHGYINVAEQNWGSGQWPGPYHNYSRKIPLHYDAATTAITLNDPAGKITGWMRYG